MAEFSEWLNSVKPLPQKAHSQTSPGTEILIENHNTNVHFINKLDLIKFEQKSQGKKNKNKMF